MSAFAGICYWNGRPVPSAQVALLSRHEGREGKSGEAAQPFSWLFLHALALPFDRLSAAEKQPYRLPGGTLLTWDGRLDNREDLILSLHRDLGPNVSDAALAAAAYARWGTSCLQRLVGDWRLAIFDAETQSLVLACDYMGSRPLYYREMPDGLAWSTRLDSLAACFNLFSEPDEDYITGRLVGNVPTGVTPFRTLRALPGGHVLVATRAQGTIVRRYWTFVPATIRYRDSGSYTERLRELLTEAVRVRLRSDRTVWCHLSGGWDSSTVTCLAHTLIDRGMVDAPRLQPLSLVHDGPWADCDERPFIEAVERWCRLSAVEVPFTGYEPIAALLGRRLPADATCQLFDHIEKPVTEAGDNVVLTGVYGDDVMLQHTPHALVEALHSGEWRRFVRLCAARAREKRLPIVTLITRLVRDVYMNDLGRPRHERRRLARHAFSANLRIHESSVEPIPASWTLKRATELTSATLPSVRYFSPTKRSFVHFLYRAAMSPTLHASAANEVYRTHVYAHRPLVEFMLGVPGLIFWEPGTPPRVGMRRALAEILPPEILHRDTKMVAGSSISRSIRNQVDELDLLGPVSHWQLVQRGYLDRGAVATAIATFRRDGALQVSFPTKWIYLEAWLQSLAAPEHTTVRELPPLRPLAGRDRVAATPSQCPIT